MCVQDGERERERGGDAELCEFSQAQRKEKVMEREGGKESWAILGALPANDKCVL